MLSRVLWYTIEKVVIKVSVTEAHKRASAKWNSNRDSITIRPEKEVGAAIRAAAAAAGQSVQRFILSAIDEYMKRR